jgi:hypothetical protein
MGSLQLKNDREIVHYVQIKKKPGKILVKIVYMQKTKMSNKKA